MLASLSPLCVRMVAAAEPGSPAEQSVIPIRYGVFKHERELFGWTPTFTVNPPGFDSTNVPYIRGRRNDRDSTGWVETLDDGAWVKRDFEQTIRKTYPRFAGFNRAGRWNNPRIVFDSDDDAYTILSFYENTADEGKRSRTLLLYSRDRCRSWQFHELEHDGRSSQPDLEYRIGPHPIDGPPAIAWVQRSGKHPARWAHYNEFNLFLPRKTKTGGLDLGEPIRLSDRCFGLCTHSGGPAFAARLNGRLHVVWGEIVDKPQKGQGSPILARTVDLDTRAVSPTVKVTETFPPNDSHNSPAICIDSKGFIHILSGSHQRLFHCRKSLEPNSLNNGFSSQTTTLKPRHLKTKRYRAGGQTYAAMVCDNEDVLHLVYRDQSHDPKRFDGEYRLNLVYQRKSGGQPWSDPQIVIATPLPGYSNYHHLLSRDREGTLYLAYSYVNRNTAWLENPIESPYHDKPIHLYNGMLTSKDGGDTWSLTKTAYFVESAGQDNRMTD